LETVSQRVGEMFRSGNIPWNKGSKSMVSLLCFGCGQVFEREACEAARHERSYCSQACCQKDPMFKLCKECSKVLPIESFQKQGKSKLTGRQYYVPRCKECNAPRRYQQQEKRRARKAAVRCDLTGKQWDYILAVFEGKCVYCGKVLEIPCQDHFIPLSAGGPHTASNILPSCRRCNSSKNSSPPQEWLGSTEFSQLSAILGSLG